MRTGLTRVRQSSPSNHPGALCVSHNKPSYGDHLCPVVSGATVVQWGVSPRVTPGPSWSFAQWGLSQLGPDSFWFRRGGPSNFPQPFGRAAGGAPRTISVALTLEVSFKFVMGQGGISWWAQIWSANIHLPSVFQRHSIKASLAHHWCEGSSFVFNHPLTLSYPGRASRLRPGAVALVWWLFRISIWVTLLC